MTPLQQKPAFH